MRLIIKGTGITTEKYNVREDARLREQDWGNFQNVQEVKKCLKERQKFGIFYYRFPNGESGADVYDRVTSFWSSITREWSSHHCLENFVIVSHGITCRLILMRYFKWTVEEFQMMWNLENCQIVELHLQSNGKYLLMTPLKRDSQKSLQTYRKKVTEEE